MPDPIHHPFQADFTAGELSPNLFGQIEFKDYYSGCKTLENFVVLAQGPVSRRAAFVTVAAAKQTANNVLFVDFVFSTDESQSYMLEVGYDNVDAAYIRIFHKETKSDGYVVEIIADGSRIVWNGSSYDAAEGTTFTIPYLSIDIPNIRIAQINDIIYFVCGEHDSGTAQYKIHKLTRSGSDQPGTWEFTELDLVGEDFELSNKRLYKILLIQNGHYFYHPTEEKQFNNILDTKESPQLIKVESHGEHDVDGSDTYGASWGQDVASLSYQATPTYLSDFISEEVGTEGFFKGSQVWAWLMSGTLLIPAADKYYFAVNCVTSGDVLIDADMISARYGELSGEQSGANEFANQTHGESSVTFSSVASPSVECRMLYNAGINVGSPIGYSLGWRRGGDIAHVGTGTDDLSLVAFWYGANSGETTANGIYEVIVKVSPDGLKVGWTYRVNVSHPDEEITSWPVDSLAATTQGLDDPSGWIVKPTDADGVDLPITDYTLHTGGVQTQQLGDIALSATGKVAGDIWTFKVGFQIVPANRFQQKTEGVADISYPRVISAHESRLLPSAPALKPNTILASRLEDYEYFDQKFTTDRDPFERALASSRLDKIQWLASGRRLIAGTTGSVWVIGVDDKTLTPDYFPARVHSSKGTAFVEPVVVESVVLFVDRGKLILWELEYTITSDSYRPKDLTVRSEHLFTNKIKQLVYQQGGLISIGNVPTDVVWVISESGELFSLTYQREHNVVGWAKHDVGGTVDTLATIPGSSGDELWISVKRGGVRYIEYMDSSKLADAITEIVSGSVDTDGEYDYTGTTVSFRAAKFANKKVAILDSDDDYLTDANGDPINVALLDNDGDGTFTYATDPGTFYVGFCYVSTLEPMPIEIRTERGTSKGMVKSFVEFNCELLNTQALTVNDQAVDTVSSTTLAESKQVFLPGWETQKYVTIRQSNALPATIISVHGQLEMYRG